MIASKQTYISAYRVLPIVCLACRIEVQASVPRTEHYEEMLLHKLPKYVDVLYRICPSGLGSRSLLVWAPLTSMPLTWVP